MDIDTRAKKLLAFDLDDTLAPSKSSISAEMGEMLVSMLDRYDVCVISGGKFSQFETQLLRVLPASDAQLSRLHIMPTCGTRYYRYEAGWQQVYAEDFTADEKGRIIAALNAGIDALGLRESVTYGDIIEDRDSQITFSALGQEIVSELGEEGVRLKQAWDPDGVKRKQLRAYVSNLVPEFEVRAGGSTSVDITKPNIDKAYGIARLIEILGITKGDVLFFGDRLEPGGNDYAVRAMGVESRAVRNPEDTLEQLKNI